MLAWGMGWAAPLALGFLLLFDDPGAPSYPCLYFAVFDPRALGESFVRTISMQADCLPLAVEASDRAASVLGM